MKTIKKLFALLLAVLMCMLDRGDLIEQGSHDELLSMEGKYAEMFRLQSEKYTENEVPA